MLTLGGMHERHALIRPHVRLPRLRLSISVLSFFIFSRSFRIFCSACLFASSVCRLRRSTCVFSFFFFFFHFVPFFP